jgi:hypothetical protein
MSSVFIFPGIASLRFVTITDRGLRLYVDPLKLHISKSCFKDLVPDGSHFITNFISLSLLMCQIHICLWKIKLSAGIDEIPYYVVKRCITTIDTLTNIYNASLKSGIFPDN